MDGWIILQPFPRASHATAAAEPEVERQRDKEKEINRSMVPDQETESGPASEKRAQSQPGHTQADNIVHSWSSGKGTRGRSGPR